MKERIYIGFFGCRNVGKSSLVNCITNQEMSVVSDIKGTTTDSVKKAMELLPLGKVFIIDTPGFDDTGELGEKRIESAKKVVRNCDIAILVTEANRKLNETEKDLIDIFVKRQIPYLIAKNKSDLINEKENIDNIIYTSTINKFGVEELKNAIGKVFKQEKKYFVSDLIKNKDIVVLVTPIDKSAPKDRLILPQQLAIRDILDVGATAFVTKETELEDTLNSLNKKPRLVITDSQVFGTIKNIVPKNIPLTSFSILMARYKGFLDIAVQGVKTIEQLKDNSKILICEGCTHHRQCNDIGTVKIPNWIRQYTKKKIEFEWTSGIDFPENLKKYDIIIHCGGCMLNSNEMKYRIDEATQQKVPFTNYGILIAYMNGLLERSYEIIYKK